MDSNEQNDLLIKLDVSQDMILKKVESLESKIDIFPTYVEKVKTLEKLTWGAVLASLVAVLKAVWEVVLK